MFGGLGSAPDRYTWRIRLKGKYPQWSYWMALPFLAPVPWEADAFYAQAGMAENGLSLNQWPVGTGPYMMTEFVRDRRHVLRRNPNFHGETYPCEGMPGDKEAGLLDDCGKPMPFIDTLYVTIEKEKHAAQGEVQAGLPRRARDRATASGASSSATTPTTPTTCAGCTRSARLQVPADDRHLELVPGLQHAGPGGGPRRHARAGREEPQAAPGASPSRSTGKRATAASSSTRAVWRRTARCRRGCSVRAKGRATFHNPVTHVWQDGKPVRRPIEDARKLLAEAGYPGGRDAVTGKPLVLNYDFQRAITPEFKSENDWMVKQFAKLGIQLEIRATDFNQYQDKTLKGRHQIFWSGWLADYPDAENFLFLTYGPLGRSKNQGDNYSNYDNPAYDALYRQLQALDDGPAKQAVIDRMVAMLQHDAPWCFGYFPWGGLAFQPWVHNGKPSVLIRDMAKYYRVDPALRAQRQAEWNQPVRWPLALLAAAGARAGLGGAAQLQGSARPPLRAARRRLGQGADMGSFILRRIGYGVLILIGVNLLTFFLFFTVNTPDDMARLNIGGKRVTQEQIDKWKAERGYDKPLYWNARREPAPRSSRDTVLWERSISLMQVDFGRSDSARSRRHRPRDHHAHGREPAAGACRCSCCR